MRIDILVATTCALIAFSGFNARQAFGAMEEESPAAQFQQLQADYEADFKEFAAKVSAAKTPADRAKAIKKKDPRQKYAEKFLLFAKENPDDIAAVDALVFLIVNTGDMSDAIHQDAMELIRMRYLKSTNLLPLARGLKFAPNNLAAETLLDELRTANPDRKTRAQATITLAGLCESSVPGKAKDLYETAIKEFGDVKLERNRTIEEIARTQLFEIDHLAVGKEAPDIEGHDLDGKPLKLSDYKGRVIYLTFFGDW